MLKTVRVFQLDLALTYCNLLAFINPPMLTVNRLSIRLLGFFLALASLHLRADNAPAPATPPPDFWQQTNLTGNWGGLRD